MPRAVPVLVPESHKLPLRETEQVGLEYFQDLARGLGALLASPLLLFDGLTVIYFFQFFKYFNKILF